MIRRLVGKLEYWHSLIDWRWSIPLFFFGYMLLVFMGVIEWSSADPGNWNDADRAVP